MFDVLMGVQVVLAGTADEAMFEVGGAYRRNM